MSNLRPVSALITGEMLGRFTYLVVGSKPPPVKLPVPPCSVFSVICSSRSGPCLFKGLRCLPSDIARLADLH